MTIFGELALYATAFAALAFTRRAGIGDAAPNTAAAAGRIFEPNFEEMEKQMSDKYHDQSNARVLPYAPKPPAATMEDMADAIEDTDAVLARTLDEAERLIEQKRTMVATLRARLDLEDADIAARAKQIERLRAALRQEPEATQEETTS